MKQKKFSTAMGVDPSTVRRELVRNGAKRGKTAGIYKGIQCAAQKRRKALQQVF